MPPRLLRTVCGLLRLAALIISVVVVVGMLSRMVHFFVFESRTMQNSAALVAWVLRAKAAMAPRAPT